MRQSIPERYLPFWPHVNAEDGETAGFAGPVMIGGGVAAHRKGDDDGKDTGENTMAYQRAHIQKHGNFEADGNRYWHPFRPCRTGDRAFIGQERVRALRIRIDRSADVFYLAFYHGGLSGKV